MKTYVSYIVIYHLVMTNSSPWKDPPIFKFGKPSISMGHLYHGYVSHNQSPLRFHHSWAKRSRKRPASALVPRGAVPLWKNKKNAIFWAVFGVKMMINREILGDTIYFKPKAIYIITVEVRLS